MVRQTLEGMGKEIPTAQLPQETKPQTHNRSDQAENCGEEVIIFESLKTQIADQRNK